MGWFALAAILGALLCWAWQVRASSDPDEQLLTAAKGFLGLLLALVLWAVLVEKNYSATRVFRATADGEVARFLFGLAAGFIVVHARAWRLARSSLNAKKHDLKVRIDKSSKLQIFFKNLLSPLAGCYEEAVRGGLSLGRLREI